jgi:hypothetical protein
LPSFALWPVIYKAAEPPCLVVYREITFFHLQKRHDISRANGADSPSLVVIWLVNICVRRPWPFSNIAKPKLYYRVQQGARTLNKMLRLPEAHKQG